VERRPRGEAGEQEGVDGRRRATGGGGDAGEGETAVAEEGVGGQRQATWRQRWRRRRRGGGDCHHGLALLDEFP
jgi:hypothetical protein